MTHPFEMTGLGAAPFRFVTSIAIPSPSAAAANPTAYNNGLAMAQMEARQYGVRLGSCEHCGMGIMINCVIRSSDGHYHVVGSDCVLKTDHSSELSEAVKADRKARRSEQATARRVAKKALAAAEAKIAARAQRKATFAENKAILVTAWSMRHRNEFCRSVLRQAIKGRKLSERQIAALAKLETTQAERDAKAAAEASRLAKARHVGEVGKRAEGTLTLVRKIVDSWGGWRLAILRDENGNTLLTFGACRLEPDQPTRCKYTIKQHRWNKKTDEPETLILRVSPQ